MLDTLPTPEIAAGETDTKHAPCQGCGATEQGRNLVVCLDGTANKFSDRVERDIPSVKVLG